MAKAKAIGENAWHLLKQDLDKYRYVSLSSGREDTNTLSIMGPYQDVMGLLLEAWAVEQGGPGIFTVEVIVTGYVDQTYTGDDVFVSILAQFQ